MNSRVHAWCAALVLVVLLCSLAACGDDTPPSPTPNLTPPTVKVTATPTATVAPTATPLVVLIGDSTNLNTPAGSNSGAPALPTATALPLQEVPSFFATMTPLSGSSGPTRAKVTPIPGTIPTKLCLLTSLQWVTPAGSLSDGGMGVQLAFQNDDVNACLLKGFPLRVQILDGNNKILSGAQINDPTFVSDYPTDPFNDLRPNSVGFSLVEWQNWCGPGIQLPIKVRFTLPGNATSITSVLTQGQSKTLFDKPPLCNAGTKGTASTLTVGPLEALGQG